MKTGFFFFASFSFDSIAEQKTRSRPRVRTRQRPHNSRQMAIEMSGKRGLIGMGFTVQSFFPSLQTIPHHTPNKTTSRCRHGDCLTSKGSSVNSRFPEQSSFSRFSHSPSSAGMLVRWLKLTLSSLRFFRQPVARKRGKIQRPSPPRPTEDEELLTTARLTREPSGF